MNGLCVAIRVVGPFIGGMFAAVIHIYQVALLDKEEVERTSQMLPGIEMPATTDSQYKQRSASDLMNSIDQSTRNVRASMRQQEID